MTDYVPGLDLILMLGFIAIAIAGELIWGWLRVLAFWIKEWIHYARERRYARRYR